MSDERKGFDWGPPAGAGGDTVKELGVYILLFFLVLGGGWLLIDSTSRGSSRAFIRAEKLSENDVIADRPSETSGETATQASMLYSTKEIMPKQFYMIQLGAFGDEESARQSYQRLTKLGFKASIALPDDQYELYRLLMGPFSSEGEADSLARKLNELDFPCFVIESF